MRDGPACDRARATCRRFSRGATGPSCAAISANIRELGLASAGALVRQHRAARRSAYPHVRDRRAPLGELLLGACGLCAIDWVNRTADFSIYIGHDGLYIDERHAPDAGRTLLRYRLRGAGDCIASGARSTVSTQAKQRLLDALGFTLDGRHRETHWGEGAWHDSLFFGILDREFRCPQRCPNRVIGARRVTTAIIVQARLGSSRLPGKVLMPLGAATPLASVLARCARIPGIDVVVCAVPEGRDNDAVAAAARGAAAPWFSAVRETDVLDRYHRAARAVGATIGHARDQRLSADRSRDCAAKCWRCSTATGADYVVQQPAAAMAARARLRRLSRVRALPAPRREATAARGPRARDAVAQAQSASFAGSMSMGPAAGSSATAGPSISPRI